MNFGLGSAQPLIALIINFLFGLLVLRRNPNSRSAQLFFSLAMIFVWWQAAATLQRASSGEEALLWQRVQYSAVLMIPVGFTLFSYQYLTNGTAHPRTVELRWTIYLVGILFSILSFTNLIITSNIIVNNFYVFNVVYTVDTGTFGPLYPISMAYFILVILFNIILYFKTLRDETSENRRNGIKLILGGALVVGLVGSITDIILPIWNINIPLADLLTIGLVGTMTVAMVRYKIFSLGVIPSNIRIKSSDNIEWGTVMIVPVPKGDEHIDVFNNLLKTGNWGIVITSRNPDDIRELIIKKNIPILWITDEDVDVPHLNPTQLYEIKDALNLFLKTTQNCIILLDQPDKNFGKSLVSSKNIWDLLTYYKALEAFVRKNEDVLIFPINQSSDINKETDKGINTVRKESWLYLPDFLGLLQKIGFLQPLMEKYSTDEQEHLSQCIKRQTNGRFEMKKKDHDWFFKGPAPMNKADLVSNLRILFSCTKLVGNDEVTSELRSLLSTIGITEADLLFHPGGSYLLLDKSRERAFQYLNELGTKSPSLCMTKSSPDKVRRNFNIPSNCDIVWLSKNPTNLEIEKGSGRAIKTELEYVYGEVSDFIEKGTAGIIFMDVFEYLYSQNGFGPLLRVFEKVVDRIATTDYIFLLLVDPDFIKPEELILLEKLLEKS